MEFADFKHVVQEQFKMQEEGVISAHDCVEGVMRAAADYIIAHDAEFEILSKD